MPIDAKTFVNAFDLPPAEAIKFLEKKKLRAAWSWDEVKGEAQKRAFTVAKLMQLDLLKSVHDALQEAQRNGTTMEDFKKKFEPIMKSAGWWGKSEQVNPNTSKVEKVQLGTPWRLELIYRQNAQSALMAGRYKQQQATASTRPYLQFLATIDDRTSPIDRKLDGLVIRADDPRAQKYYPPLHFGCRMRMRSLSQKQLDREGLKVADLAKVGVKPAPGFDTPPGETFEPDLKEYPKELASAYKEAIAEAPATPARPSALTAAQKLALAAEKAGLTPAQLSELKKRAAAGNLSAGEQLAKLKKAAKEIVAGAPPAIEKAPVVKPTPKPIAAKEVKAPEAALEPPAEDSLTKQFFGEDAKYPDFEFQNPPSDPKFMADFIARKTAVLKRAFGERVPTTKELAGMAGAPSGAKITVGTAGFAGEEAVILVTINHRLYDQPSKRTITRNEITGELSIHNDILALKKSAPPGMGTRILASQVKSLRESGFSHIETTAAGDSKDRYFQGYKVWPKLGYDAPLAARDIRRLPPSLAGATHLRHLMASKEGSEWWAENGSTINVKFDLKDNAYSVKFLRKYLERKGVSIKL